MKMRILSGKQLTMIHKNNNLNFIEGFCMPDEREKEHLSDIMEDIADPNFVAQVPSDKIPADKKSVMQKSDKFGKLRAFMEKRKLKKTKK